MSLLGEMLVKDKVISKSQLEEAIQAQVIFGGRLGTNLIELGFVNEQNLTKYLAKKCNVPTVDWNVLNRIKPEVIKLFNKKLAKQAEAFPLKLEGRDLWVVMTDPQNFEAIEAISFATGKKIKPLVLPEIRVYDLLTRFYNIGRELRYINLAMMYKKEPSPEERQQKPATAGPPSGMSDKDWREREEARKGIDFKPSEDLLSEEDFHKYADGQFVRQAGKEAPGQPPPASVQQPPPPAAQPEPMPPPPARAAPPPPAPSPESTERPPTRPAPDPGVTLPSRPEPAPAPIKTPGPVPFEVAPPRAPAPPPARPTPPPQAPAPRAAVEPPRTGRPPYKEVAQALYSFLIKGGVEQYLPRATLQEFLKLFVKNQLKNSVLSLNYLASWLIMEVDVPVEWLEPIMEEFKAAAGPRLGITVLIPGERLPEAAPPAPPPVPAAAVEAEAIGEAEEAVEELPAEALAPVEPELPAPSLPAAPELPAEELQPVEPALPAEPTPAAEPRAAAEDVLARLEAPEPRAAADAVQVLELAADDLASVEEAEEYVPEEEPEEEEVEEEVLQLTLEQARKKLLEEVNDRRDISRIVLGFAHGLFKRSLLFTVRGQTLFGWDGLGPNLRTDLVESIMLPLAEPGVFQLVNTTKSFFLGPVQPGPINDRFLKLLGGEKPNNVFIMPVVVNEKVVYMFYGDNGHGEFVPGNAPELQIVAYQVPRALDMLIKRKKAKKPAA